MKPAIYSLTIDPSRLASDQLRELAKNYTDLANVLDSLNKNPQRQAILLAEIINQENKTHEPTKTT